MLGLTAHLLDAAGAAAAGLATAAVADELADAAGLLGGAGGGVSFAGGGGGGLAGFGTGFGGGCGCTGVFFFRFVASARGWIGCDLSTCSFRR